MTVAALNGDGEDLPHEVGPGHASHARDGSATKDGQRLAVGHRHERFGLHAIVIRVVMRHHGRVGVRDADVLAPYRLEVLSDEREDATHVRRGDRDVYDWGAREPGVLEVVHLRRPLPGEDDRDRLEDDLEVHGDRPARDVAQVQAHHVVEVHVRAAAHLPGAGEARLHGQALHGPLVVLGDLLGQRGPGAHHGHVAQKDVQELRELVDGVPADEAADARDARVVPHLEHGPLDLVLGHEGVLHLVGVLAHGAELPHGELARPAVGADAAHAPLAVERAAGAVDRDGGAQDRAGHDPHGDHQRGEGDVERALHEAVAQALAVEGLGVAHERETTHRALLVLGGAARAGHGRVDGGGHHAVLGACGHAVLGARTHTVVGTRAPVHDHRVAIQFLLRSGFT